MTVKLRVLCWDHPRCTGPMAAAASAYRELRPGVTLELGVRSLARFGDQLPWDVEEPYDLIFVDYPMTGAIARRQALVPLDTVLPADVLARAASESVGASHASYALGGHQWALGVDAACQVAAYRLDRLADLPHTWDDVLRLASSTATVALPLCVVDSICVLMSLSANAALAAGDPQPPTWLRPDAVEFLVELAGLLDPACFELDPPRLLDAMAAPASNIAYVPFLFGYAMLARPPLAFTDVPGVDGVPRGAVLGGAGLAVSSSSAHIEAAAEFAAWCMDAAVQRDVMLPAGAQPGNRRAWDAAAGMAGDGFFEVTRRSIDGAYVRPRDPWWPGFQREAGELLTARLRDGATAATITQDLTALADRSAGVVA